MAANITIVGDKKLQKKLSAFKVNLAESKKALNETGEYLVDNYIENFKVEGKKLGAAWKPLSAATITQKAKMGYGGKGILERTGKLKRSIKILQLNKFLVKIGSKNPYYKYHQSSASRKKLPRRKMVDITTKLAKGVTTTLRKYFIIPLIK